MFMKACFLIGLIFLYGQCNTNPNMEKSLLGKWEGKNSLGKTEAFLTVKEGSILVEFVSDPPAYQEYRYNLKETSSGKLLEIEGVEEPFIVVFDRNGRLSFDLTPVNRTKVDVPRLSILSFDKIESFDNR